MESLAGMLLVAPPQLTDPNFAESVVLMLFHNETGAFGLVLNRVADDAVADGTVHALIQMSWQAEGPLRTGGPVGENGPIIGIGRCTGSVPPSGYQAIETATLGPIGLLDVDRPSIPEIVDVRLFSGYSGWGPGQVEGEVLMGGWIVVPGLPSDAFDLKLESLWGRVLRRANRHDPTARLLPDDIGMN
jgi:putative transcriptional regulator